MPRGRPGVASNVLERPTSPQSSLGLSSIPTLTPGAAAPINYDQMLAEAGVFRDPTIESTGLAHHYPVPGLSRRGNPQMKKYSVALSAVEARNQTKATGDRHDYYSPGLQCPRCQDPLVGWVLGGRKFAVEHDHVTEFEPELYIEMETAEASVEDTGGPPDGE